MRLRNLQFLLALIALLAAAGAVSAQSGRRSSGSTTTTTTTTTPSVSGPKTVEKKPALEPRVRMLVGINGRSPNTTIPYYIFDTVLDTCMRRLEEAEIVLVNSGGNTFDRGQAIKAAKKETIRYVVMLEVGRDFEDPSNATSNSPGELYIEFMVFEPETAKVKKSGGVHNRVTQPGRIPIPLPGKAPAYSEYAVKQAAQAAADRILEAFDIKIM